jgi:hypothetical protein
MRGRWLAKRSGVFPAADRKGQVLVLFVFALAALLGLAALGVDVGYMYTVRHELQRCADSGALAGASAFYDGDWNDTGVRTVAEARANSFASKENVVRMPLAPGSEIGVAFNAGPGRIRVDTSRTVPLFFSRLFLGATKLVRASAVAEAAVVDRHVRNLKPWIIPFPWEDIDGDGLYDPGEPVHRDCPEGTVDKRFYFCQGTQVILKVGTPYNSPSSPSDIPSLQQEAGHFFALDFGTGASGYRDSIKSDGASSPLLSIGDETVLETGNMVGPTLQAASGDGDSLISQDPTSYWNEGKNLPESDLYHIDDGSWMASPRIVRIPVYDPEEATKSGKVTLTVASFAGFWVERVDQHLGTVVGRFVPLQAKGESAGPLGGVHPGPNLRVLRLVE